MNGRRAKKEELARLIFMQEMPDEYAAPMEEAMKNAIARLKNRGVVTEYSLAVQCTIYAFVLGQMVGKQQERARRKSSQQELAAYRN